MDRSHNQNIDILKGLACLCVVYIHATNIFSYVGENKFANLHLILSPLLVLANCGVPIFFIISGYLSKNTLQKYGYKNMLLKKIKTLLIPYIIWNVFYMLIEFAGHFVLPGAFADLTKGSVIDLLVNILGIPFIKPPIYNPLWFIRSLFLIFLILPIINYIVKNIWGEVTLIIISLILMFVNIPVFYNNGFFLNRSVPFFIIGLLVAMNEEKIKSAYQKTYKYIIGVAGLAIVLTYIDGYLYYLAKISLPNKFDAVYHIFDMVTICIMIFVIYMLVKMKRENDNFKRLLIYISGYSFMIYVLHGKVISILQVLSIKLLTQNILSIFLEILIFPVIAVVVNICIAYLCRKYIPKVYCFITGGR